MVSFFIGFVSVTISMISGFFSVVFSYPSHSVKATTTYHSVYAFITTIPTSTASAFSENTAPSIAPKISSTPPSIFKHQSPTLFPFDNEESASSSAIPTITPPLSEVVSMTPLSTPLVSPTPLLTPILVSLSSGLNPDKIFFLVNDFRNKNNLPSFQKNDQVCSVAQTRAQEVFHEIFITGNLDAGLKAMKLPYWVTENIINDDSEQDAVDWWVQDKAHRQVMLGNYTYSCVGCSGYNCAEVFTSLIPK